MKNKFMMAGLILGGMFLLSPLTVHANTIGGNGVAGYFADYGPSATDWITSLSINKFNSSLGVLTKIDLFFSGSETSTATVTAPLGAPAAWDMVSVKTRIHLVDPSSTADLILITPTVSDTNGSIGAGAVYNVSGTGYASKSALLTNSNTAFDLFIGSGTISLSTYAKTTGSTDNLTGDATFHPTGTAGEHLYVIYTYDPPSVPEPATMLLFGAGLAGLASLAGFSRKDKK